MAAYTGVGSRIREQMMKLGYVRTDGEPDVQRFSWDFRYDRTLIYAWLADKATPFKDLIRLARDLQISVEWLLQDRNAAGKKREKGHAGRAGGPPEAWCSPSWPASARCSARLLVVWRLPTRHNAHIT